MLREKEIVEQDYAAWNRTVQGFMRMWDVAEALGITSCLVSCMEDLPDGDMVARLAEKGNCRETYLRLFLLSLRALLAEEPNAVGSRPEPIWEEQILAMLDIAIGREGSPLSRLLPESSEAKCILESSVVRSVR